MKFLHLSLVSFGLIVKAIKSDAEARLKHMDVIRPNVSLHNSEAIAMTNTAIAKVGLTSTLIKFILGLL